MFWASISMLVRVFNVTCEVRHIAPWFVNLWPLHCWDFGGAQVVHRWLAVEQVSGRYVRTENLSLPRWNGPFPNSKSDLGVRP